MAKLNLCEILKGHEGETFWSPEFGNVYIESLNYTSGFPILVRSYLGNNSFVLTKYGLDSDIDGKITRLFPSKDQRDWNKWVEEKNKIPKTWSELTKKFDSLYLGCTASKNEMSDGTEKGTSIEYAALAQIKIYKLIEAGYGGIVGGRDKINFFCIQWSYECKRFVIRNFGPFLEDCGTVACFHTKALAIEFLSYPENIQLLKDYHMIKE